MTELPLAHHGSLIVALPFAGPAIALGLGIAVLALRDRLSRRGATGPVPRAARDDESGGRGFGP